MGKGIGRPRTNERTRPTVSAMRMSRDVGGARTRRATESPGTSGSVRRAVGLVTGATALALTVVWAGGAGPGAGGGTGAPGKADAATARSTGLASSIGVPTPQILIESRRAVAGATPPSPAACGCYEPAQFAAAYGLSSLYAGDETGTGQTIVIVDSFGSATIQSDLATFDAGFGLPAPPSFKIIAPEGAIKGSNADWATETSLDVEYAHAIAPGADILLVETPVAETEGAVGFKQIVAAENYVINHRSKLGISGGAVISQSFTAGEQTFGKHFAKKIAPFRSAFRAAAAARVTVLAASGDAGVSGCANAACSPASTPVNSWPSSDPLVTSVGGLSLSISRVSPYAETAAPVVWNEPGVGAGGGGDSTVFPIPSFQDSVSSVVGSWRGTPDVSMSASTAGGAEIYETSAGGWVPVGGTSEATPEIRRDRRHRRPGGRDGTGRHRTGAVQHGVSRRRRHRRCHCRQQLVQRGHRLLGPARLRHGLGHRHGEGRRLRARVGGGRYHLLGRCRPPPAGGAHRPRAAPEGTLWPSCASCRCGGDGREGGCDDQVGPRALG